MDKPADKWDNTQQHERPGRMRHVEETRDGRRRGRDQQAGKRPAQSLIGVGGVLELGIIAVGRLNQ